MKALVLAGGGGSRLWPISREDLPKQFIPFGSDKSLLQKTIERLLNASFVDTIVVSTNIQHQDLVREQLEKIDPAQKIKILVEPARRNTAPAIGFGIKYLEEFCSASNQDTVLVVPSDHLIEPADVFLNSLVQMDEIAKSKKIVTFGIHPNRPETGYGYIQIGKPYASGTFKIHRFVEKPDKDTAEKYLKDPTFFWNAGMFLFSIETFWDQMETYIDVLRGKFQGSFKEISERFHQMPSISIDYALMEKTHESVVCPLAVSWSDVGSWESIYETMEKNEHRNVQIGNVLAFDTKNSLIFGGKRLISTIGLEDMLIVETDDATFISKKGESQKVKEIVLELQKMGSRKGTDHTTKQHPWGTAQLLEEKKGYSIQKILLLPNQSWECTISSSITLLEGKACIEGEDLSLRAPFSVVEGKSWVFRNNGNEPAQFLWVSGRSFFD